MGAREIMENQRMRYRAAAGSIFFARLRANGTPLGFLQTLDVRTKMVICILCSISVVFVDQWPPLLMLVAVSGLYALAHRRLSLFLIAYAAIGFMFCVALICAQGMALFMPQMKSMGWLPFLIPFFRVTVMVNVIFTMAVSSRVQDVLETLKSLRLPFFIFLPATVMIRFIPGFINDVKQIAESMKIKGYRINPVTLTFQPRLTLRLLLTPIVIRALRSSDELSIAAELKGIGSSRKMTFVCKNRLAAVDYGVAVSALVLVVTAIVMG